MTTEDEDQEKPTKKSKLPLLMGVVLALVGSGSGFYATWSGLVFQSESSAKADDATNEEPDENVSFVPIEPLVVSLPPNASARHLRFRAELEVPKKHKEEIEHLLPRITNVLNTYLRALEPADLEASSALITIRGQMLRRIQIVVGQDHVNDLLVMEFVLN